MKAFKIGHFLVEPSKGTLQDSLQTKQLEPKAMAVLCVLKDHKTQVVSQQKLFELVWPDRIFSPSSLQRVIALIRKALNETSQDSVYLFTHPKLGYRLEGVTEVAEVNNSSIQKDNKKPLQRKRVAIKLALLFFAFVVCSGLIAFVSQVDKQLINNKKVASKIQISHGHGIEFNAQFSPRGKYISYLTKDNNSLNIIESAEQAQLWQKAAKQTLLEHVWLDEQTIIALTQTDTNQFTLTQFSHLMSHKLKQQPLYTLDKFLQPSQLTLDKHGKLYLIAQAQEYKLLAFDLSSGQISAQYPLSNKLVNASLASSPKGLYFHYFDGEQSYFRLLKPSGEIQNITTQVGDVIDLTWDEHHDALLISNKLIAQQLLYAEGQLTPLHMTENTILSQVTNFDNHIAATALRRDMDILTWRGNQVTPLIDSEYADYQGVSNDQGQLAYLSTKNGYPQLFVKNENSTRLVFDNKSKHHFIPPLNWSPDNTKIAFSVAGKLFISDVVNNHTTQVEQFKNISRVFSWSPQNTLLFTTSDNRSYEYDIATGAISAFDHRELLFLTKDKTNHLVGVKKGTVFWAEKQRALAGEIKFAFLHNNLLIVQVKQQQHWQLLVFNNELKQVESEFVPSQCHYVTGAYKGINNERQWICTRLSPSDSHIQLFSRN